MFYEATSFNGDIGGWNVGSVVDMDFMFYEATSFNGDIGDWDVEMVEFCTNFYTDSGLSNDTLPSFTCDPD